MEENKKRIEELTNYIAKWQEELDTVWKGKESEAAEVERRNLKDLISNAQKEIDELNGIDRIGKIKQDPKDLLEQLKQEKENGKKEKIELTNLTRNLAKNIEELKEMKKQGMVKQADYEEIYGKYEKDMNEIKEKLEKLEEGDKDQEKKDFQIRVLTKGRMDTEKEISDIEKQIRNKQQEISEIQYGTDDAMEEKELSDGTKIKVPKINRLYQEMDKLKEALKEKQSLRDEFQQYIDELKGIEKEEKTDYTAQQNQEYTRYFHGQGDIVENDQKEDKEEDRRANDEYFGFKKVRPPEKDKGPKPPEPPKPPKPPEPPKPPKEEEEDFYPPALNEKLVMHLNKRTGEIILSRDAEILQKTIIDKKMYSLRNKDRFAENLLHEYADKIDEYFPELRDKNVDRAMYSVDPMIYKTLEEYDKKAGTNTKDLYVESIMKAVKGEKDAKETMPCDIIYDLRKRNDSKEKEELVDKKAKLGWIQRRTLRGIARNQGKPTRFFRRKALDLATVKEDKGHKKYAILAALGLGGAVALGTTQCSNEEVKDPKAVETMAPTEKPEKGNTLETVEPTEKPEKGNTLETVEPTQNPGKENENGQEDSKIGKYVTVRTGAHLYNDPYDAVYEQLNQKTNGKIVVKGPGNEDRVYQVTKEGLYCPDGQCIEISNGNLRTAMKNKGIDVSILDNIDSEKMEQQGYKRMLHVVADGIAQWIEEGDSLELQVDKFGNRVELTQTEKEQNAQQTEKAYEKGNSTEKGEEK